MTVDEYRDNDGQMRIPIVEEQLNIRKEWVETGRVRVSTGVETEIVPVSEALASTAVRVERVPVDRLIDAIPEIRTEGERIIIPVTEEVLVKRIRIIEEVHLITERSTQVFEDQVALRHQTVEVERASPGQAGDAQGASDPGS